MSGDEQADDEAVDPGDDPGDDPPRSFPVRLWRSFNEQGGLAKVLIGVMTAVGTAAVLAFAAFVAGSVTGDDDPPATVAAASTSTMASTTASTAASTDASAAASSSAPLGVAVLEESHDRFGQAIWGFWMDGPMPPPPEWPGPDWEAWLDDVEEVGGAYGWSAIRIVIEGLSERSVSITEARAVKDRCVEPDPDAFFWVSPEGEAFTIGWEFDLSEEDPRAYAVEDSGRDGRYFEDRTLVVAPGEIVTIDMTAVAGPLDCEWHLELDVVVGSEASTIAVDDSGRSFRTSGDAADTPTYALRAGLGFELWLHPDPLSAFAADQPLERWAWSGTDWVPADPAAVTSLP